jgi:flagellar motor switch protein FliM
MIYEGTREAAVEVHALTPATYDQRAPGLLPASEIRFAQGIQQEYNRSLGPLLSAYLEVPVTLAPRGARQSPADEFLKVAGDDLWFLSCSTDLTETPVLLGLPGGLLRRALGILIALPSDLASEGKPVTEIELHVVREFIDLIVQDLVRVWAENNLYLRPESRTPIAAADLPTGGDSITLILESAVTFGDREEIFFLAVPVLVVRIAAAEADQGRAAICGSHDEILVRLAGASVHVEAILEGSPIRMRDLLTLHADQILSVGRPVGSPFHCLLNGKPKYIGEMTCVGRRQAFQIDSVIPVGLKRKWQSE